MAEDMTEKPTEGTTSGGRYLTRKYLVRNLQNFWNKIKVYIADKVEGLESALSKKVDQVDGQGLSTNDFTTDAKIKLDGIAENANNYSHPTDSGNKHIPSGGQKGQILRWGSDGTAVWGNDNNTTYSEVTQSAAGLMSASDKAKLDGIDNGANKILLENTLESGTDNPVKSRAIKEALEGKVDKGLDIPDSETFIEVNSEEMGCFILNFNQNFKHLKVHFVNNNSYRCEERFWITDTEGNTVENLQGGDTHKSLMLTNLEDIDYNSSEVEQKIYNFYIECLELANNFKYKPFMLQVIKSRNSKGIITTRTRYVKIS